jgi:hypothetical protein
MKKKEENMEFSSTSCRRRYSCMRHAQNEETQGFDAQDMLRLAQPRLT